MVRWIMFMVIYTDKNKLMKVFVTTVVVTSFKVLICGLIILLLVLPSDDYILVDSKDCRLGRYLRT